MSRSASQDRRGAFGRGFYVMAVLTAVATFALIVLGTVVRVSDSGLGCGPAGAGAKGWPLCDGRVLPLLDVHTLIEYSHRALAAIVVIGIVILVLTAWRRYRAHTGVTRALRIALGIVVFQAILGGITVETGLTEWIVTAHLATAMAVIALLVFVAYRARPGRGPYEPVVNAGKGMQWLLGASTVAILLAIVSGGYMSATQRYGTPDYVSGSGAHTACANTFPGCHGSFLPIGKYGSMVDVHLTHRFFMYAAAALILATLFVALVRRRNRGLVGMAFGLTAVLLVQVLLGAMNVWLGEKPWLITVHLAVGTLLWVVSVSTFLRARPEPELDLVVRRGTAPERKPEALRA